MVAPESYPPPQRLAFARDGRTWTGEVAGLELDRDGYLSLVSLPGPADGVAIVLPGPYAAGASGIAAGPCGIIFVADTAHNRIVFIDTRCNARAVLPPPGPAHCPPQGFNQPRGLAVSGTALGVADSGNARMQTLAFPLLEMSFAVAWTSAGALQLPTGVAADSKGRWYLLDETAAVVVRVDAAGFPDPEYDAHLATEGAFVTPAFLALSPSDDILYVTDTGRDLVLAFEDEGTLLYTLPPPPAGVWTPGALAAGSGRVYVHDTTTGAIHLYIGKTHCCELPGWIGPVTALAVDGDGNLLIKPGLDDVYYMFVAGTAYTTTGSVTVGPVDAGEQLQWFRAALDAIVPQYTTAALHVFQANAPAPSPAPGEWIAAMSTDTRLASLVAPASPAVERRWLWMRATLETHDNHATPVLRQLRAETPGEHYLDYLPAIYARSDERTHELAHFLSLTKTEQGGIDEAIDAMPQLFAPALAPATTLTWLSDWVTFELPAIASDAERRHLIGTASARHERRGTPASIRDFVELFTGIRPSIIEAFNQRGLWMLGDSSLLGCDTVLAAADPDGIVVPDPCAAHLGDPPACCPPERGRVVVGESGPLERVDFGLPLFLDTAFRFDVLVPRHRATEPGVCALIRRILDREKPAHTQYCLCLFDSELRVGLQALVGVDTIVGGSDAALRLETAHLDGALVGPLDERAPRVGVTMSVGSTALLT